MQPRAQLAGYPHVVATLWRIADAPAAALTLDVYRRLRAKLDLSASANASDAANALHHAVRHSRQMHPHDPVYWASHVHFGP